MPDGAQPGERSPGAALTARGAGIVAPPAVARPDLVLPARRPRRRGLLLALLVALGFSVYAGYILFFASSQYEVELRFAVRSADTPRLPGLPGFGGGLGGAPTDSYAVVDFLRSREASIEIGRTVNLPAMFGRADIDPWSRLSDDAPPEVVQRYLSHQVIPYFDHTTGIVIVQIRAFTAQDAYDLARVVERISEDLVNRMSLRARQGLLSATEAEMVRAEARLTAARDAVRSFRESSRLIDPKRTAESDAQLLARLETELSAATTQLQTTLRFAAETAPQVVNLRNTIDSVRQQIRAVQSRQASPDPEALSAALRRYETLETESLFALKSFEALLATLERIRGDASRQQLYLASIVRAEMPVAPTLPKRWRTLATALAVSLSLGLIALLVLRTLREHMVPNGRP